jgi:hypothetical protein
MHFPKCVEPQALKLEAPRSLWALLLDVAGKKLFSQTSQGVVIELADFSKRCASSHLIMLPPLA